MRALSWVFTFVVVLLFAGEARADLREAPVGGKPIPIGDGRVACGNGAGGWKVETGGREVRPPTLASAIGSQTELRVAATEEACAKATENVTLVVTGTWPTFDAASFTLALDEGRLEAKGHGLKDVAVEWPLDQGFAADVCTQPKVDGAIESCSWGVPKTLNAEPGTSALHWLPKGALWTTASTLFDADGHKATPVTFRVMPSSVTLGQLIPADASVDVSSGLGIVPLTHPEAVAGVDCGPVHCSLENGGVSFPAPPAAVSALDLKLRLIPHVSFTRRVPAETQPALRVSILRCPMDVASGPVLRGSESTRAVVRVTGGCTKDVTSLRFLVGSRRAEVLQTVTTNDAVYAALVVGNVSDPNVSITAVRGETDATVVAVARIETRAMPQVRTVVEVAGYPKIDFIPNNRPAVVHYPHLAGLELVLLPVEGVYSTRREGDKTLVEGDADAAGIIALQFAVRVATLPAPLDKLDLAVLTDPLQRNIKEVNIPAPFDVSATTDAPLAELVCTQKSGQTERVVPGHVKHFPFGIRDNCRVIFHRERLSPADGAQKVNLEIEVDKLDGTPRPEAHVNQTIVLRPGTEPRLAWIKGIHEAYDRVIVKLSIVADESHYLGALEIPTGAPAVQWSMIMGTGRIRIYATTTIPTGLYRFGDAATSGLLALSFGVISRMTWLDSEGHEGLLGLEAGVIGFGLTGDVAAASMIPLTQVGVVTGIGLSIPIAGVGTPLQASINLHGWFEERIAGYDANAANPRAFIFGPSFSVGNLGATF